MNPQLLKQRPIALDFSEGIDRKTLQQLRDRFLDINRQRYQRACSAMGTRQQTVLELLPLVLHANHPALPGYLHGDCPRGLAGYEPDKAVLAQAKRVSRSFQWRSQGRRTPDLDALFMMGSSGTIAQSSSSDVDVWLCHRDDLETVARKQLHAKAEAISAWAHQWGLELHIFLMTGEQLRSQRLDAEVDAENCGSAQHFLLLDEFFRTAIHLGGRYPLWWLVPAEDETQYQARADMLVTRRFIKPDEYLDLGSVPQIPPGEFLGAGVWQLYKGIDAPWKAILKLLLIESYAREDGRMPLALAFKRAVYSGQADIDDLDPYIMLYRQLERFLSDLGAPERLELVRRSFYLKTGVGLSRRDSGVPAWRVRPVKALVEDWGWNETQLRWLDQRQRWRINDVLRERRLIVNELTHSYRFLSRLARTQQLAAHIRAQDLTLLGRKLYAAFQRKAGKVELINPNIAPDLAEENLAFHHRSARSPSGRGAGWLLYRDLVRPEDADFYPSIKTSAGLMELLTWCHCNGLLTSATRLNVQAGRTHLTIAELQALIAALRRALPGPAQPPGSDALMQESRILRFALFVNVGVDPMRHLSEQGVHKLSEQDDALGFSALRENLVLTVDQVTLNSWQEVSVHRYEVGDTLIQCLKNYLAGVASGGGLLPKVEVHCYCASHATAIARRVEQLFQDVTQAFFFGREPRRALRYVIEMDQRFFLLKFVEDQPRFVAYSDREALFEDLARPQRLWSPIHFDRRALLDDPATRYVSEANEAGRVQVVYEVGEGQANLWLLDENGSLFRWRTACETTRSLLVPLFRFLDNIIERRQLRHAIVAGQETLEVEALELVRDRDGYHLERRELPQDQPLPEALEVQALGVAEPGEPMRFDIFCDHQEFSALEYGSRLMPAVAHYIVSHRQERALYPVYITDLNLPHDMDPQDYQIDLQTVQYVQHKVKLEKALNQAMQSLSRG
ncbi:class I adenylate cyclase [Marinobacteraceae bacterium S3BR75-40.1]